jgi:hypothetical protein
MAVFLAKTRQRNPKQHGLCRARGKLTLGRAMRQNQQYPAGPCRADVHIQETVRLITEFGKAWFRSGVVEGGHDEFSDLPDLSPMLPLVVGDAVSAG